VLLAIDGFDTYATPAQLLTRSGYLQWVTQSVSFDVGRVSGTGQSLHVLSFLTPSPLTASFASNLNVGFIGFALQVSSTRPQDSGAPAGQTATFNFTESNSGQTQFTVTFNGLDGSITYPGGRTSNNLFPTDAWFFVEFGWKASKSGGYLTVRINNVVVLSITGVNLSPNTANEWVNGFNSLYHYNNIFYIDDFYICDNVVGPGSFPCNSFLGDRRVFALSPTGNGDLTQWTPNTSAANWQEVTTNDGDTTFNQSNTGGAEDLFTFGALPGTVSQVIAVQVTGTYRKSDATSQTLTQRLKSGGNDVPGVGFLAPYGLSTSYVTYSDLFPVDPGTGASWTLAALAPGVIQAGYKLEAT
jgi:hypothetical protein